MQKKGEKDKLSKEMSLLFWWLFSNNYGAHRSYSFLLTFIKFCHNLHTFKLKVIALPDAGQGYFSEGMSYMVLTHQIHF